MLVLESKSGLSISSNFLTRINLWFVERTDDALETNSSIIATGCPFCNTMMTDGIKHAEKESEIQVLDVAELIANAAEL